MFRFVMAVVVALAGGALPTVVAAQGATGGYGYQNGNNPGIGNGAGYGGNNGGGIGTGAGVGGGGIGTGAGYGGNNGYGNGGGYGNQARQVQCESWNYQPARCAANTSGGVRLLQVLGGDCRQGSSWGYDRNGIWVANGCRAMFAAVGNSGGGYPGGGYPGGGYPGGGGGGARTILCESWQYQPARCPADVYRRAEIAQVQGGDCTQGRTWGWDRGGIWVNGGCRARFRVY